MLFNYYSGFISINCITKITNIDLFRINLNNRSFSGRTNFSSLLTTVLLKKLKETFLVAESLFLNCYVWVMCSFRIYRLSFSACLLFLELLFPLKSRIAVEMIIGSLLFSPCNQL